MVAHIEKYLEECFEPDVQKLANVVLYTLKRHLRIFCSKKPNNRKIKKLISIMPCFNKNVKGDQCLERMVNHTAALIPLNLAGKTKIKYVCW